MQVRSFFRISLTNLEPFRIGGPDDPLSGDHNTVARVGATIAIPGTSLKGALRAEMERFLIAAHYQNQQWRSGYEAFKPCIPSSEKNLSPDEKALISSGKYREGGNCHYPCQDKGGHGSGHAICPACYLLGAMGLEGFLRVPFLTAEVSANKLYAARINRATGTVAKEANRPYELVPPDTAFTGTLEILEEDSLLGWKFGSPRPLVDQTKGARGDLWLRNGNAPSPQGIIDKYIIGRLQSINFLGGYKSKGFGRVTIQVEKIDPPQ